MDIVLLGTLDDLVELGMGNTCDVFDDDGLLHLVRYNHTDAGLAKVKPGFLGRVAHVGNGLGVGRRGSGGFATGEDGKDSGDFAADDADACGVLELAGGLLETEVECFLLEVAEPDGDLGGGAFADVFDFGSGHGGDG